MAQIKKLKNKTFSVRVSYYHDGKRKFLTKSGFLTKKQASMWGKETELRIAQGDALDKGNTLFIDYFIEWYHTFKEPSLSEGSKRRYKYTIKIVATYFAGKKISEITRTDYQKFLNAYANRPDGTQRALASSEKVNTQIKACVRSAVEEGTINRDFTLHTQISGRPGKSKEMKFLNAKEASILKNALLQDISAEHPTKTMALVALYTGCRFSEVAGLTWNDINPQMGTIRITKAWDTVDHKFKTTKNEQSKRVIKVGKELFDILHSYHVQQVMKLQDQHVENPDNLVFWTFQQKVPDDTSANQTLHKLLKRLGIKDITFHGLRHTHASYLIYKGVSIYYISERLGHSNYSTTIRVYSHLLREMEKKESAKAVAALSSM